MTKRNGMVKCLQECEDDKRRSDRRNGKSFKANEFYFVKYDVKC